MTFLDLLHFRFCFYHYHFLVVVGFFHVTVCILLLLFRLLCIVIAHHLVGNIRDNNWTLFLFNFFFLFINCDMCGWCNRLRKLHKQTNKKLRDYKLNFPKAKLKFVTEFKVKYPPKERKIKQRDKKGGREKK